MGTITTSTRYRALLPLLFVATTILYTYHSSHHALSFAERISVLILFLLGGLLYLLLDMGFLKGRSLSSVVVIAFYALVTLVIFYPTLDNVFRSDYWIIKLLFSRMEGSFFENIKNISLFEFMGDIRFQPFAHIFMYLRHALFGENVIYFHLFNLALHILTAFMIFLVLVKVTRDVAFSFLFGLIFIALQSQFDTVVWTYHIYIITAALFFFGSILLSLLYLETTSQRYLAFAFALALISAFLYEPMILAPAAIFFIIVLRGRSGDGLRSPKKITLPVVLLVSAYILYLALTFYGTRLIESEGKMSFSSLFTGTGILLAIKASLLNFLESTFLKNTGITALVGIADIVYVNFDWGMLLSPANLIKLAYALFLLSLMRFTVESRAMVFVLVAFGFSYIFIISFGRVISNDVAYVLTQPRYQYFVNGAVILALGAMLIRKYRAESLKQLMALALGVIFFWNCQNVLQANSRVDYDMKFMNSAYYRVKAFTDEHPGATVFPRIKLYNKLKFFLGADISLDLLLKERVTRFSHRATHIFDGGTFKENPGYLSGEEKPCINDFNISWAYLPSARKLDTTIVGSREVLPSFTVTQDGFVEVRMMEALTGRVDLWRFSHPKFSWEEGAYPEWVRMEVRKKGQSLSLYFDGSLQDSVELKSSYRQWSADGSELLGDYYLGRGAATYVIMLFIDAKEPVSCK